MVDGWDVMCVCTSEGRVRKYAYTRNVLSFDMFFLAFGTVFFPHLPTVLIQIDIILYLCRHSGTPAQRALFSAWPLGSACLRCVYNTLSFFWFYILFVILVIVLPVYQPIHTNACLRYFVICFLVKNIFNPYKCLSWGMYISFGSWWLPVKSISYKL